MSSIWQKLAKSRKSPHLTLLVDLRQNLVTLRRRRVVFGQCGRGPRLALALALLALASFGFKHFSLWLWRLLFGLLLLLLQVVILHFGGDLQGTNAKYFRSPVSCEVLECSWYSK